MIKIKNINRTPLEEKALIKLIESFCNVKKDIFLRFDGRIGSYGLYVYNAKKQRHDITISNKMFQFKNKKARIYELIGTILHEVKHAQQQEKVGSKTFTSRGFGYNVDFEIAAEPADYFSAREIEARVFENEVLLSAIIFYWKNC